MSKIIIHNNTNLEDNEAMLYVNCVINQGKLSKTKQGEQYSFITTFKNGIIVSSGRKKDTYTFWIDKEDKR